MINFDKHLKEILYEHDFIIIPNIGAFVAEFKIRGGKTDPKPYKTFSFNSLLTRDDSEKFFKYILSKETIAKQDLEAQWNQYVADINSLISSRKRKEVPDVGYFDRGNPLSFDINRVINFYVKDQSQSTHQNTIQAYNTDEKSNANTLNDDFDTHGETINTSLEKETIVDTLPTKDIDSDSFLEEVYEEEEEKKSVWWWLLPLLLVGGAAFTYFWNNMGQESAEEVEYTEKESLYEDSLWAAQDEISDTLNLGFSTEEENNEEITSDTLADDISPEEGQTPNTESLNDSNENKYHVWAGLFRKRQNAVKLVEKLKQNSIPAEMQKVKGMRRVYVPVQNESKARTMVRRIEQLTGDKAVYFEIDK